MSVEIDLSKIGMRVKTLRKERNLTQDELALSCGCTSNHLSAIENGAKPSLDLIVRLAAVLDTGVDYFLSDTPHAHPRYFINSRIAPKLERCTARDLQYIEFIIDELLKYKEEIISSTK